MESAQQCEMRLLPDLQTVLKLNIHGDFVVIRNGLAIGRIWKWPEDQKWSLKSGEFGMSLKEFRWIEGQPIRNSRADGSICIDVKSLHAGCLLADKVFEDCLIADIKLANNGYLRIDCMRAGDIALGMAMAKSGKLVITNGLLHLPTTKPEFFQTPYPVKAFPMIHEGPDYEDAILARQEAEGIYD
ncbi:hypothetical protein BLL52_4309 [Rhodoferax antarcticus ANT.BR]|uniref:Uncharacterized protein n=2 Tax=Rhodoferax antarcticus TaxID=81479 RepID=A0A1Q8Y9R7_9BURK|nr:hypothetical protein BLL52_4309 [Rhodoferax antarcticus ANT.BR]